MTTPCLIKLFQQFLLDFNGLVFDVSIFDPCHMLIFID